MNLARFNPLNAVCVLVLLFACPVLKSAQPLKVDRVLMKGGKMMVVQNGRTTLMESDVTLPDSIVVTTNGVFTVGKGRERVLGEGQVLGADGMLISQDGSIVPVQDHLAMKNGGVTIVKDGDSAPLDRAMALPDGSTVTPDGFVLKGLGSRTRLLDGQIFKLNGIAIPAKDTVTRSDGKVIVQKDGSPLLLRPDQSMMMSDGTKVFGNGTVITSDGRSMSLTEGQILVVEGVVRR